MTDSSVLRTKIERHLNIYSMKPLSNLIFSSPVKSLQNSRVQSPNTSSHSTRSNFHPCNKNKRSPQIQMQNQFTNQLNGSPLQAANPLAQSTGNFIGMTPGSGNSLNTSEFNNYSSSPARGLYESLLRDNLSDVKSRTKYNTMNSFYKPNSIEPKRRTKAFLKGTIKDELDELLTEQLSFHTIKIENLVSRKILADVPKEMSSYIELIRNETEKLINKKVQTLGENLKDFIESKFRFFGCLGSDEGLDDDAFNFVDLMENKAEFFQRNINEEGEPKQSAEKKMEIEEIFSSENEVTSPLLLKEQERQVMKDYEERYENEISVNFIILGK
jgi:hypothetical protein